MNLLPFSLAWKYITFGQKDRTITFMMRVCFLGILIGTFSLMLTLIIMNGFEKVVHEKMQGINSHAIIYAPGKKIDDLQIKTFLKLKFPKAIKALSGNIIKQVIIDKDNSESVLFLKGIEPETEHLVSSIDTKIIESKQKGLPNILKENQILVGHKTAKNYNLKVGSTVTLLIPEPNRKHKIFLKEKTAVVAGIFKLGLDEYDSNFAYASIDFVRKLFNEKNGVNQLAISLSPPRQNFFQKMFSGKENAERKILEQIRSQLPSLKISSWKELYPDLVSSLVLEKYVMFFILALITLVASMSIISLLFMQIQQKRRDVAIFKAMGMPHKSIKQIFLSIGLSITTTAALCGLGLAAIAGWLLERYPFIQLPDVYYVSHLPARMDPELFIIVFLATLLLGFLSTWIPAKRTRTINVAQVLRQE
jgi:lipoprotein-releasing system permease protein